MRTKTSGELAVGASSSISASTLRSCVDAAEAVLDVGAALLGRPVLVRGGVVARVGLGELPASPSSVAEKNSVWRFGGHSATMRSIGRAEAHVEHAVGLVEDEDRDGVEREGAACELVLEAAGGRDDDVRAGGVPGLRVQADAAVDGGDFRPRGLATAAELVDDLRRELAGRGEDEGRGAGDAGRYARRAARPKASVLPEPVGDLARTSRPASTSGRTSDWIANGSVMSRRARAERHGAIRPGRRR